VPLLAWAVVVASAVGAHASDLCLEYVNGGSWVLESFKIPRRNKCVSVHGFEPVLGRYMMTGTACTTDAGNRMTLQYISQSRLYPSYFESAFCEFNLPLKDDLSSGCQGTWFSSPGNQTHAFGQSLRVRVCEVDIVY
jgi:hypothetical protein